MSRTKRLIAVPPLSANVSSSTSDARQQPCAVEIDLVHGISTRSPSSERDTHGMSLPLGN
jgi:hypothetical protein